MREPGGPAHHPHTVLVGEEGPELLIFTTPGTVIPSHEDDD